MYPLSVGWFRYRRNEQRTTFGEQSLFPNVSRLNANV